MPTNLEIVNRIFSEDKTAEETAVGMVLSQVVEALININNENEMPSEVGDFDIEPYINKYKAVVQWLKEEKI